MNCKFCGQPLPDVQTGRRPREYCSNAHRQAHYRQTHQTPAGNQADLTQLHEALAAAQQQITELEQENTRLLGQLDIERRFHEDHEKRSFKAWLNKQPAARVGKVGQRIRSDTFMPAIGSRALYEAHLHKDQYSLDDLAEFAHLWKAMLLSKS